MDPVIGIPLLMVEISVARHTKQGAPGSMRALNKHAEHVGWLGVSTAISDKFHLNKKKTTLTLCIIEGIISLIYVTGAGLAILDIVDYFINSYTLLITGILEVVVAGWFFHTAKILDQINRNTKSFKMPGWWFLPSIKVISPIVLGGLFTWNLVNLIRGGGIYGKAEGYSLKANILFGWLVIALILVSGFIIKAVVRFGNKKQEVEDDREDGESNLKGIRRV